MAIDERGPAGQGSGDGGPSGRTPSGSHGSKGGSACEDTAGSIPEGTRPARFASMGWAIDGPGQWLQGRPVIGVAVLLMLLPVVVNAAGVQLFGYSSESFAYSFMTWVTIVSWVVAAGYLATYLIAISCRLSCDIRNAVRSRSADDPADP